MRPLNSRRSFQISNLEIHNILHDELIIFITITQFFLVNLEANQGCCRYDSNRPYRQELLDHIRLETHFISLDNRSSSTLQRLLAELE